MKTGGRWEDCQHVFDPPTDCSLQRQVPSPDSTFPCSCKAGKTENSQWENVLFHSKRFHSIVVSSFGSIYQIFQFNYYLFNYYYWLFVWFILVQHRFFQKMIQPHLFQMPWNQQFQDLRWWFQKWQGPHSSWRKGSPVAQSLTGVKLPLCRGTQRIMIVFMRVHVSLYSLPPNKLFKTTFHIFPLFQTCFYMFLSFRRYLDFVFEKFCFLKRLSSKESCSVFCVLLLFQHSTPWYFQGPKPQGTQMDSVYFETPVCQNPKKFKTTSLKLVNRQSHPDIL